jgi:hypothetical protein
MILKRDHLRQPAKETVKGLQNFIKKSMTLSTEKQKQECSTSGLNKKGTP